MAGRGCSITIKLLGIGEGSEDISLPVAMHSPLAVLKQQLAQFSGIAPADQVLILCDLSDPDRNSDVLLIGRDHMTLLQCGIRMGALLTLHPLGITTEMKQKLLKNAFNQKKQEVYERPVYSLESSVSCAEADHRLSFPLFC
jgi:hypothetical protein